MPSALRARAALIGVVGSVVVGVVGVVVGGVVVGIVVAVVVAGAVVVCNVCGFWFVCALFDGPVRVSVEFERIVDDFQFLVSCCFGGWNDRGAACEGCNCGEFMLKWGV